MHEKRFNREIERLRDPDRIALLEVERVVNLVLENLPGVQTVLDVWPDEEQSYGPPLEHRLSFKKITSFARQAGFTEVKHLRLENLTIYIADC